jgi:hypothetical protein
MISRDPQALCLGRRRVANLPFMGVMDGQTRQAFDASTQQTPKAQQKTPGHETSPMCTGHKRVTHHFGA